MRTDCFAAQLNKYGRYLSDVLPRAEHPADLHGVISAIRSHFTAGGE